MQLVCPAGSLPALKSALRQGADAIYVGFRDDTNARHFAGLNLDERQLQEGLRRVHEAGRQPTKRSTPIPARRAGSAGSARWTRPPTSASMR